MPWLEAICGCPIWYVGESGTMYPELPGGGWDAVRAFRTQAGQPLAGKLREFYGVLRDLAAGRYPMGVAMPMRGPIDILGALVGVERMCLGFAESPQLVREALDSLTDMWIEVVGEQIGLAAAFRRGHGLLRAVRAVGAGHERRHPMRPGGGDLPAHLRTVSWSLAMSASAPAWSTRSSTCIRRAMHVLRVVLSVTGFAAIQVVVDPGPADPPC